MAAQILFVNPIIRAFPMSDLENKTPPIHTPQSNGGVERVVGRMLRRIVQEAAAGRGEAKKEETMSMLELGNRTTQRS